MKALIMLTILIVLTGVTACTFNVSMAHTNGKAADVIDDTQTNTPEVSPHLEIPANLV